MAEKIVVDKTVLSEQIEELRALRDSKSMLSAVNKLDEALRQSQGDTPCELRQGHQVIKNIFAKYYILFQNTLEFLENTRDRFVEMDEGLAEKLKGGK